MTIAPRLKKLRKARGMTVGELAQASGVFTQSIYVIESGKCSPTIRIVAKLAKGLGVSVANLVAQKSRSKKPATAKVAA